MFSSFSNLLSINIRYDENIAKITMNVEENRDLNKYKNTIDKKKYKTHWDKFKKLINPYEYIHISKKKHLQRNNASIANYIPLSRSYFKLWEMIHTFDLLEGLADKNIKTAHIAEGPGGFMECLVNYRNATKNPKSTEIIYGITLKSKTKYIPGWNKARELIKRNNIIISYGKDGTGNIYNIDNIIDFSHTIGHEKCDFITSDGGFDFSIDFNHQEQLAYRLLFCEIVATISNQKIGGRAVFKFFDIYTELTMKFLYLCTVLYEAVYIHKPITSRPANSEKYIIAKRFKGVSIDYLKKLNGVVRLWDSIKSNDLYIIDLFKDDVPKEFREELNKYNKDFIQKQVKSIKDTLYLIDNKPTVKQYNSLIHKQITNAVSWCEKYGIDINHNSKYLSK
tara:strand:+ start:12 stop:1193 length:1182 start_codon:yes stop_codon:yes gene_type:complete